MFFHEVVHTVWEEKGRKKLGLVYTTIYLFITVGILLFSNKT